MNPSPAAELLLSMLPEVDVEASLKELHMEKHGQGGALGPGLPSDSDGRILVLKDRADR